ncbi:flagellin N-terminal helical domain-containing protein [Clostridium estertheticum]|uniref:flagellin N-terminal helical domain-containing protein n=1 Tax=Clostridium estertheticum TaxID=238834 RepID=UPI001CF0E592|nr:flagellin [Clostridium estertheticum]MCB2340751.1 flagellin [Clostridium estertheticum]
MIINHNLNALNANRNMNINSLSAGKSMQKLSSGLRINTAGDDAAGLAISEKMRGQIRGLDQASSNAQDGISMVQTAEGALNETTSILQRMRELAVQAGSDTNTTDDRGAIQKEVNALTSEINRIGNTTEFNTQKLINGNKTGAVVAHVDEVKGKFTEAGVPNATGSVTVDTIEVGNLTATNTATAIASAINTDATLSAKYTATVSSASGIVLTQKIGSSTAPAVVGMGASGVTTTGVALAGNDGKATLQIGANTSQQFTVDISDMRSKALGLSGDAAASGFAATGGSDANALSDSSVAATKEYALDVTTAPLATAAITTIDAAIKTVSSERAKLGAYTNRLEHTIANLGTTSENMTSAESRIRDVDMAKEMSTFSKNNILSQAAQAMLAQANQQPQQVLQLLR